MKPKAFAPSASAEWRAGSGNVAVRAGDGGGGSPALHKPKARKRGDPAVPAKRGLRPRRSSPCDRGQEQAPETRQARRLAAPFCAGKKNMAAGGRLLAAGRLRCSAVVITAIDRSEQRRVGQEVGSKGRS